MKLLIIDGNSIINRAFYGIRILSTAGGEYTNAVYGFLSTYFKLMEEESPDGVCVCFDLKAPTFRHLEYADYKAGRRPMPEELASQLPLLKDGFRMVVFSVVIMIVVLFFRKGIMGTKELPDLFKKKKIKVKGEVTGNAK